MPVTLRRRTVPLVASAVALLAAPAAAPAATGQATSDALTMRVLRPAYTAGLRLANLKPTVHDGSCGRLREQYLGIYGNINSRGFTVLGGLPRVCGDLPVDAPKSGTARVRGRTATVYRLGDDGFLLVWREAGAQYGTQTTGLGRARTVRIARSMRPVAKS